MMMSALLIVVVTVPLVFTQSVTSGALIASMMLMWPVWTVVAALVPSFVLLALAGLYNAAHYWRLASDDVAGRRQEGGAA